MWYPSEETSLYPWSTISTQSQYIGVGLGVWVYVAEAVDVGETVAVLVEVGIGVWVLVGGIGEGVSALA